MIDLEAFSNGFGLVVISLLLGIIIKAIVSVFKAGSSRFHSIAILILLLSFSSTESYAAETKTGQIDLYQVNQNEVYFIVDEYTFNTSNPNQIALVNKAYYERTTIEVTDLDADPGRVDYLLTSDTSDLISKSISLMIGALSCSALALGLTTRF